MAYLTTVDEVLTTAQAEAALTHLPGWSGDNAALRRTIEFSDFPTAIAAVAKVAEIAEQRNHHPDIDIRWRTVTFVLSTHSAGGVTGLDLGLAAAISDALA